MCLSLQYLCKEVAHELIVVADNLALEEDTLLAAHDADEVAGDDAPLMDELVERVLAVGAGLAKVNLTGLKGQHIALHVDALAVALHGDLLVVRGQLGQGLRRHTQGNRDKVCRQK